MRSRRVECKLVGSRADVCQPCKSLAGKIVKKVFGKHSKEGNVDRAKRYGDEYKYDGRSANLRLIYPIDRIGLALLAAKSKLLSVGEFAKIGDFETSFPFVSRMIIGANFANGIVRDF